MEVTIRNSTAYGVNATLILGNSSISRSTFASNAGTDDYYDGNVHFWYKNFPGSEINYLHINSSQLHCRWTVTCSPLHKHQNYRHRQLSSW